MPAGLFLLIESAAFAAVLCLIPTYMGFLHVAPAGAALYAGVGGVAMAVGESLQFDAKLRDLEAWEVGLWCATIAGTGGFFYLLALMLI